MNKKLVLLAALFLSGSCVQSSVEENSLPIDPMDIVVVYEQTMARVHQELEQINFLQWLLSLGESVENPFFIMDYTDGTMVVMFSESCLFPLRYQNKLQVMIIVIACQDPEKRARLVARAGELEVKKQMILKEVAELEAEGQRMMDKNPL